MRTRFLLGALTGGVVDIVATNLLTLPVLVVAATTIDIAQVPKSQLSAAMLETLRVHPALYVAAFIAGILASILGGYVAGMIAKGSYTLSGALSAYLCVGMGIYAILTGKLGMVPLWQHIVILPLSPVLGVIGARLYARRRERQVNAPLVTAEG
ncbi:MAG TPA: hypothetical protein VN677_07270 [Gemmatimonadaceae bacterium]|jgi:hypothetical protein|nr:hypothetical protein [Gemmatimonadaceae bacterium]